MNFPPYQSKNHHTVKLYGRLFFIVTSNSRAGLLHFVDLEESEEWRARFLCTCESFKFGERPCRHISACFEALAEWANIAEHHRDEWIDRLMFLLNMGHSFKEVLQSESLKSLRTERPAPVAAEQPKRQVRHYQLPSYETARTAKERTQRRLPARVHRKPA